MLLVSRKALRICDQEYLDNTLEISAALNALASEGYVISADEVAALSPYQTKHIKRFGSYEIDFSAVPALIADDLTFQLELPAPPEVVDSMQENKGEDKPAQ